MENMKILKFFADYIEKELGIIYSEANYFQLEHRLKEIAQKLGHDAIDSFYDQAKLGINGDMKSLLLDTATNNETSFFRDMAIFTALTEFIIPDLLNSGPRDKIDLWSAASSSGQEIYSILMQVEKARSLNSSIPELNIFATDVSAHILKRAQEGIYSHIEVQRGLTPDLLSNFFVQGDSSWQVKESFRSNIRFEKLNLLHDWGNIGPFDIVFCRNVLIYQSVENKTKIIKEIYNRLRPNGYLVLGATESLFGLSDDFEQLSHGSAVFFKKKS